MRLLVLGGTRFLGRAVVDEAVSRGYDVTTFSRGVSGHPRPGAQALHGDRTRAGDLRQLEGRGWDAVIDTSVLAPAYVAASATMLAGQARHYTYVSTISVYRDWPGAPATEDSPVRECAPGAGGNVESLGYGELKAGSERAVAEAFAGRSLIARAGLIVGPHEDVGRIPWWLARCAAGGTMIAPGSPERPLRLVDARDLAAWLIDNSRRGIPGVVNVPGYQHSIGEFLTVCGQVTSGGRREPLAFRWVPDADLLAAGVRPWTELPMWAPNIPGLAAIWDVSGDRALRTGLRYRPLADTVRDTWLWLKQEAAAAGEQVTDFGHRPEIGLSAAREREILAALE